MTFLETVMKPADLTKVWNAPDNSRLTPKQQSFRLPLHVAAKLDALCELFPNKSKTEIVGDLLATAIDEVEQHLPTVRGAQVNDDPDFGAIYALHGPRVDFQRLANKFYKELERELGNKNPTDLYTANLVESEKDPG
jgi:hypothetical protein